MDDFPVQELQVALEVRLLSVPQSLLENACKEMAIEPNMLAKGTNARIT